MRFGYRPDPYDPRDWTVSHAQVRELVASPGFQAAQREQAASAQVLPWGCVAIRDQGDLGSCVAFGVTRAIELLEQLRTGTYQRKSPLFVYWNGRDDAGLLPQGDTGLSIRDGIKAAAVYGACPESAWPYDVKRYQQQPSLKAFLRALNHQLTHYVRLTSLEQIKAFLRIRIPVVLGFLCFASIDTVAADGWVPLPKPGEEMVGGHCVVAEGFDDRLQPPRGLGLEPGAVIFGNSWGTAWGRDGYGCLPYRYFGSPLRVLDAWAVMNVELPRLIMEFS